MATRADRIETLLLNNGNRLAVFDLRTALEREEETDLNPAAVSATVAQDNKTRERQGLSPRFNIYGDGTEKRGWISLHQALLVADSSAVESPARLIEKANAAVRESLKSAIQELSWREFESNFLMLILEALGFHDVQITQATRDGGVDARCSYMRGIVASEAIVSAKHWTAKAVAADEVQRLRGIRGAADTGVIVTSSSFSEDAKREAEPSQNQRPIVLIDGDLIVSTCLSSGVGVEKVVLPTCFRFVGLTSSDEV